MVNKVKNKKKLKVIIAIILTIVLIGGMIGLYFLAKSIYDGSFSYRCTTSAEEAFELSDFESLTSERHTFTTKQGHQLVGYLYSQDDESFDAKAVVVFAHGLGAGGQNGYMDMFNYLCENGYYVFAYDATANDESEGEVVGGLPQGYIDLDYAINYAYTIDEIKELPFVLMGYSWGGLSVANVLNYHPEVEAVVSLAGWNKSMNLIEYEGCKMVGGVAKLLLPFASVYEYQMYGKYAFSTALKGFANSDCEVMIVHGEQDETIPIEYGYDTYFEKYGNDERFVFKKYEDRDHIIMNYAVDRDFELMADIVEFFDNSL